MSIDTNITLTAPQKEYYQRFVNLGVNDLPMPQGDGVIRISPFDDYYLFTLFNEVDGEDTPIDLSNVGDIFLNFIGTNDEIDIKNHTQVEDIDIAQGEVLFRITRDDSRKILALDNNNFYISTKMIAEDGNVSDESVVYQGIWLAVDEASRTSLTSQIEDQRIEYSIELAKLKEENELLKKENAELIESAGKDTITIQTLEATIVELENEVQELTNANKNAANDLARARAKNAQALAQKRLLEKQQVDALKKSRQVAQTGSRSKWFFRNAANNLEGYGGGKFGRGGRSQL
jgi:hypothetical protein